MRIWSIHPKYLDRKGFGGLWLESIVAKNALEGKTVGYRNHPQLNRFKACSNSVNAINCYLKYVYHESLERKYNFDRNRVDWGCIDTIIPVNKGQVEYEMNHLLSKLKRRDKELYDRYKNIHIDDIELHPVFIMVNGDIEKWEIIKK